MTEIYNVIAFKAELRRQEDEAKKLRLQGQNPDGGTEGDFMSEAKDWAGELISGQTGTGRILVSLNTNKIFSVPKISKKIDFIIF